MLADTLITFNAVEWPMQSSCCCRGFNNTVYIKKLQYFDACQQWCQNHGREFVAPVFGLPRIYGFPIHLRFHTYKILRNRKT